MSSQILIKILATWIFLQVGLFSTPVFGQVLGQGKHNNPFSMWVKLSLMGYSQSEIESTLQNVDAKELDMVRHRLRSNVITNLQHMNIQNEIRNSTNTQDLKFVIDKIRTEIRFAGLEKDHHVRSMIRDKFGISVSSI